MIRLSNNCHSGLSEDKMKYINNPQKLQEVISTLAQYQAVIKEYFFASLNPRVNTSSQASDKITRLFIIADSDRQGKGEGNINIINATASFKNYLSKDSFKNLPTKGIKDAHQEFLQELCDIKGMEQKTANLFLKYLVMFQNQFNLGHYNWVAWEPYLDIPLDIWVLRLLGNNYLDICSGKYESDFKHKDDYTSPSYSSQPYVDFQAEIKSISSQVNQPAITLDGLWFVGSKFCAMKPLLCDVCWLKTYCIADKTITWPGTPPLTKRQLKQYNKLLRTIVKLEPIWLAENPGKKKEDYMQFIISNVGLHWVINHP